MTRDVGDPGDFRYTFSPQSGGHHQDRQTSSYGLELHLRASFRISALPCRMC